MKIAAAGWGIVRGVAIAAIAAIAAVAGIAAINAIATSPALAQPAGARPAVDAAPGSSAAASPAARLTEVGTTRRLEILPLVDWFPARPDLRGEAGVAYLVRTDTQTILFDVGGNLDDSDPSPLEANMQRLGIGLDAIDTIVISHPHGDHVGGVSRVRAGTFALGRRQVDLAGKRVVVPSPLRYPGLEPQVLRAPAVLGPGVASTGPITGRLHIGPVDEQALAIRVEGKGIVLLVGCGHQGLARLLDRTAALFDEPLYAVIGGLHYPVPSGRWTMNGVDLQRWAVWGDGPGASVEDVQREADLLAARGVRWVALSPHDSSDAMIDLFRRRFGDGYHDVRVGEPLVIGATTR